MKFRRWSGALAIGVAAVGVGACGGREATAPKADVTKAETKTDAKTDTKSDVTKTDVTKPDVAKPDADPPDPAPAPAKSRLGVAPSPDHAVVLIKGSVVVLDASGARVGTLVAEDARWCRVDPRAGVLWYQHGDELALAFLDLEGEGPPVTVLEKSPETLVIQHPGEVLGRPEPHHFQDGVVVHMETPVRVEAILGCEGDQEYYCFEDEDDVDAARAKRVAAGQEALAAHPLVAAEALTALVARGKDRHAIAPDPARGPEPTTLTTVPRDACEESPEDCGTATRVPGTAFWEVVVSNSRGDFFHETSQLYDPVAKVFFDPTSATARSPKPLENEPFMPTWISPSGTLAVDGQVLVKLSGGTVATDLEGACGFWGGGWELPSG